MYFETAQKYMKEPGTVNRLTIHIKMMTTSALAPELALLAGKITNYRIVVVHTTVM